MCRYSRICKYEISKHINICRCSYICKYIDTRICKYYTYRYSCICKHVDIEISKHVNILTCANTVHRYQDMQISADILAYANMEFLNI